MDELWAVVYAFATLVFGVFVSLGYFWWTDIFFKAGILNRIKNIQHIICIVKTSASEASGIKLISVETRDVKILGFGYEVNPKLAIRVHGILCLFYDVSNPKPRVFNDYDVDIHHVLFNSKIRFRKLVPLTIPKGAMTFGDKKNAEPFSVNVPVEGEVTAEELNPGVTMSDSPYEGFKEAKEMAKTITYNPTESPKNRSSILDAYELIAEARASIERMGILNDIKNFQILALLLCGISLILVVIVISKQGNLEANQGYLASNMTVLNSNFGVLNQTIQNKTVHIIGGAIG